VEKIKGSSLSGIEAQTAAVKLDRELEALPIAEAARRVLDPLDLRVHHTDDPERSIRLHAISEGDVRASLYRHVGPSTGAPVPGEYLAGLEEALDAELVIVVCGVATDVGLKHAIDGFLPRHDSVILLTDDTSGLGLKTPMRSSRSGSGADSSR
jgi:hypothetical protein